MKGSVLSSYLKSSVYLFLVLLLFGCSDSTDKDQTSNPGQEVIARYGGTYRMPLFGNPSTLDPAYVKDQYGEAVVHQLFDCLIRFDRYLTVLPGLAETWQVEDAGRVYRFTLRKNAKFHDGSPVTAADVVFSLSRLMRIKPAPAVMPHLLKITGAKEYRDKKSETIPGLKILNAYELEIELSESHVPFLTALGMYQTSIVPKKTVMERGSGFGVRPVGSGPFHFLNWNPGQSISLEKFGNYYAGPAYLDGIEIIIYPGGKTADFLADFKAGRLDEIGVFGDIKQKLADMEGLQWFHRPSLSLFFYGMNCRHGVLSNPAVRKALSAAIDRNAFVGRVYGGQYDIATTILPPGMPGYRPENPISDDDPDLARDFIQEAFGGGAKIPELELVSAFKSPRVEQEMEMMKRFWAEIGVSLRVKYITDWPAFEAYIKSDKVQLYRYAWFADMPDPDSILHPLFASDSPNNFMGFRDQTLDRMLQEARGIVDPLDRAALYQKAESYLKASLPLIPLFYMSVDRVYQPYVKSVSVSALGAHTMPLNKIWLDRPPSTP